MMIYKSWDAIYGICLREACRMIMIRRKIKRRAILSVIIQSDKPDVQALLWETLYHPTHKFIGRNPAFTLTRRIAEGKAAQANLHKGLLSVLLFTSLPENVDAERGYLNVQEVLMPWITSAWCS